MPKVNFNQLRSESEEVMDRNFKKREKTKQGLKKMSRNNFERDFKD